MSTYAQTSLQLFQQLKDLEYSKSDRIRVNNAYKTAVKFFAGCYRPCGKTFIAHLVGTASILTSQKAPVTMIAAALLHSIYAEGDFGTWKPGITKAKRQQMRTLVGKEVEAYLCQYAALKWNKQTILALHQNIELVDRDVLTIRLADVLEDCLDLGILYCRNSENRQKSLQNQGSIIVEIAEKIGLSDLAAELETAFKANIESQIPQELLNHDYTSGSFVVIPASQRQKLPILVKQIVDRQAANILSSITLIYNYLNKLFRKTKRKLRPFYIMLKNSKT